jgi:FKBP-type peptidyl-prolyl cis-trans isomerase
MLLALLACSPLATPRAAAVPWSGAHEPAADVLGLSRRVSLTGLAWYVLREGAGAVATKGSEVEVHYSGFLAVNGHKFDSSWDRGEPLLFRVGAGRVIKGWDEGVAGMKVGEQRQLHVPAKLGYGPTGAGGLIPPGADLVFDVELVAVR